VRALKSVWLMLAPKFIKYSTISGLPWIKIKGWIKILISLCQLYNSYSLENNGDLPYIFNLLILAL
jgi:hypothetical protein